MIQGLKFRKKKLYEKTFIGVVRSSFFIDEEDTSIEVIEKVKLDTNAFDMPKFIKQQ